MHASYLHIIQQNLIFEEKIKKGNNFKIKNKKIAKPVFCKSKSDAAQTVDPSVGIIL